MGFVKKFPQADGKKQKTSRKRRKLFLEPLEPRLLLSADHIVGGIAASLTTGLTAVGTEFGDLIQDDPVFDKYVPGIVETLILGDNVYQVSPTLEEAMDISVDVDVEDDPGGNAGTLEERFEYIKGLVDSIFETDTVKDERALRTMDLDSDDNVTVDEAFKVMVVGQLQNYLDDTTIVDMDSSGVVDAIDVALQVEAFLDPLILFLDPVTLSDVQLDIPDFLNDRLDLTVNSASSSYKNDTLTWTMDFALSLIENNTFDLGYEAENLGIALDPGTPPNPNSNPYSLPVSRTIDFGSFSFGVRNVSGGVIDSDFFFAAPDLASDPDDGVRIGVNVGTPGTPYDTGLAGVDVNVGFLGAEIISSTGDGVVLDMDAIGGAVDPSHPKALGFTEIQLGTLNTTGTIEAENTIDLAKLATTPIEFTLKLGTDNNGVEHIVTLPQGDYIDADAVVSALNTALTSAGFSGLVTASDADTDSMIELTVVGTAPTPLGFSEETGSLSTISGTPSTLVGKTAGDLSGSPDASFLLVVTDVTTGVSVARQVQVNISAFSNDNGTLDTSDDLTTLEDVRSALQAAATTVFGGTGITITAAIAGSNVTLSSAGNRLEITRRFTIETLEQITLSELQGTSQVFEVTPDSHAAFEVNLALEALPGLEDSNDLSYKPVGTIKVDIDPFSATDVKKIVIDKDPPTNTEIVSTSYQLTDSATVSLTGGLSDLQDLLDFNVIAVSDILGIFTQIGNWFDRVTASDLLLGFDIPFAEANLGSLLNFKDLIADTFLIDDRDDGPTKSGSEKDIPKLLEWIGSAGEEQLRALFGNAQQLETRLNDLLPLEVDATVFTDTDGRQNLTYDLSIAGVTLDVDPQTAGEQPLTVPLDFEIDLGSVANFETSGQLAVTATGDIGFTLGIILGNAVDVLEDSTPVPSLNSDNGVTLNTNLALTSLGVIDPLVGRLSADATFVVTTFVGTTATPYTITLTKAATDNNLSLNDPAASDPTTRLLDDLNLALAAAGLGSIIVAETDPMQGDTLNAHIVLRATDSAIERFQVETATNNTAFTELSLQTQSASTVYLVAPKPLPSASPGADVDLTFAIERTGGSTSETITLTQSATVNNVALQSLIEDLNAVLPTGIVASQSGGYLVLSAIDSDITAFTVSDATELGLITADANAELIDFGVITLPTNVLAGVQLRGGAMHKDPFGRLDVDVTFTINTETISISKVAAADNTSIDDLIRDLNTAIGGTSLAGKVAAINDNYRIALRAIDKSVDSITVAGLDAGESAALGMADGSSAAGLTLRSTKNAPVSFGVSEDTTFTVEINSFEYSAELKRDNTITNRSLYDLAGSLNSAINSALGGAGKNPLIVTVQGGQIVIGLKTGIGSNLIGDPSTTTADGGVAPSSVASFSVYSESASFINELKLASATGIGNANLADTTDFIIFFRDGTSKKISLDTLDTDTDKDQEIDSTLGALITEIEAQAGTANLDIGFGSDGTSLKLTDKTMPDGISEFKVVAVNGSSAAVQLGIMGSDTANINVNEVAADSTGTADGVIDGGRIATIDLVDRVYLEDVIASAQLAINTLGVASAEASFGFAGIKVESIADQTLFSASAYLPLFDSPKTLGELFDALSDETGLALATLIGDPTLTLSSNFDLNVSILPGFDVAGFTAPTTTPTITFMTDSVVIDLDKINAVLPDGQLFPDLGINIQTNDFGDLLNFESIKFDNVLDAVEAIAGFLNQFEAFGFLGDEIPVLGLSVNDLLDIADQFQQAVDDFRDNPAGGIQKLAQKIREAFGLPEFASNTEAENFLNNFGIEPGTLATGYQLIQFSLVGASKDILKLDLRLPVAFSKGLNVDLNLGDALGTGDVIDIQGGAGMAASGYLDAQLSFGIDLTDPTKVLIYDDTTGVFGGLNAGASNLQFNAAIGPLGAFIKDGLVDVGIEFDVTGDDGDTDPETLNDFLDNLKATLTGDAEATLPVFFPTDSEYFGDISFTATLGLDSSHNLQFTPVLVLPDFTNIDLSSIDPFGSIPLMLDSLDFFLQGLQDILDGEVFGIELPLIGDQLQGGVDFIESLRNDVMTPIRKYAEQAPELGKEIVQKLLYSLLGPGSDGVTVEGSSLFSFLGLTGDFEGLNMLKDYDGDSDIDLLDLPFSDDGTGALWQFQLGGTAPISIDLAFDLGIPALALESDAALDISLTWGLAMGLGINTTDGAYILIGDHSGTFGNDELPFGDKELQLSLDIDVRDESSITGSLGFLQLEIAESSIDTQNDLEDETRGTYLHGEFSVDLVNSADASDTKLSFSELGSIDAIINLEADAEVNLEITGRFNPDLLPSTISALLPEISGRFVLDWETGNIVSDDFDFADSLKFIGFRNVQADMGSFINDLIKPFVEKISEVTDPLQPIIDVVTAPIPVISDLAGQPITLVDIAGMTGYVEPALIYAVADIISLVNEIGSSDFGAFGLPLGDFVLLDSSSENTDYLTGSDLLTAGYTLASDSKFDGENLAGFLGSTVGALDSFTNQLAKQTTGDTNTKDFVSGLQSGSKGGSGFDFPVFDDPSLLFGLLLGKDIPLITYDLAPFKMEFTYVQKFPIWDALFVRIGGSVGLTIDFAFGYDTAGVREFAEGGFSNPLDLLSGFYISDTNQPTGEGVDVPELILQGELFAGAELNLGIASAGAEGVIGLVVNFDLYDPDSDGRVRIDELVGNVLYEWNYGTPALAPIAIFDVYGEVYAQLRVFVESLFFKIEFEITPKITLVEFEIPFDRQPFLATERGDGSLLLNIGPNAAQRLNGDTRDIGETMYVKSISDGEVLVWGMGINESDAQKYKVNKDKGIFGYGGAGNDIIDLSGVTHGIVYTVEGGTGDDTIRGTAGGGELKGDLGNDTLIGGAGVDFIYGGTGNDTIDGLGSADIIFGDNGTVSAVTGGSRYRSFVGEKDGDDNIKGDEGNDIIFGGGGFDWIEGGLGNDIVLGDGGNFDTIGASLVRDAAGRYDVNARGTGTKDTIFGNSGLDVLFGGAGNDLIDGGADNDEIEAGDGFDVVYGGSGADTIFGGNNDDIIFGFRDPQGTTFDQPGDTLDMTDPDGIDKIYGEEGNDFIRGQNADDELYGGRGADIMFGDGGNDKMQGEAGGDIMFGGANDDTIDGAAGADIVFGDDGLVAYVDFDPIKTDFNFTGSRIRFLGGDQLIGDSTESLIGGYLADAIPTSRDLIVTQPLATDGSDTIIGGDGKDIVFGGGGTLDKLFGDFDPVAGFTGPRPNGQDILIGDGGRIELSGRRNARAAAESNNLDGIDQITGNDGGDYIFGGGEKDTIYGFQQTPGTTQPLAGVSDNDVILGDNGEIIFDTSDSLNHIKQIRTTAVVSDSGMSDVIDGDFGNDIVFGGLNSSSDVITGDVGDDILVGDNGEVIFDADGDLDTLDSVESYRDALGGDDIISGNDGNDILIGGTSGDTMAGDNGEDILLGDNARIELIGLTGRLLVQVAAMPAPTAIDLITTTDIEESTGGEDNMSGNAGNDIMLGGVNNGGQDTMYGDRAAPTATTITNDGDDIMLGDNGLLDFTFDTDTDQNTLDLIRSFEDGLGGIDIISGNKGSDLAIGGTGGDTIYGDDAAVSAGLYDGADIAIGDNVDIFLVGDLGERMVLDAAVRLIETTDDVETTGGADLIMGNAYADVIIGGVNNGGVDRLHGDATTPGGYDTDDILIGDNGLLDYGTVVTYLDLIQTFDTGSLGGVDWIFGNDGSDIAMGGTAGDNIYGDFYADIDASEVFTTAPSSSPNPGKDILLGDGGEITLIGTGVGIVYESGTVTIIQTIETDQGGFDIIQGNDLGDIIMGGFDGDWLYGEAPYQDLGLVANGVPRGDDWILGDNGRMDYTLGADTVAGRPDVLTVTLDTDTSTLDRVQTYAPNDGSGDVIRGNAGNDTIFGGTGSDLIWGDTHDSLGGTAADGDDGDDLIFGDHGKIYPTLPTVPDFEYFINNNFFAIDTNEVDDGDDDVMFGNGAHDTMLGQQGDDVMFGGTENDILIGGHNISGTFSDDGESAHDELDNMDQSQQDAILSIVLADKDPSDINDINDVMDGGSDEDLMAGDNAIVIRQDDSISPRYQLLSDSVIYSMLTEDLAGGLFAIDVGFSPNILNIQQLKPGSDVGYTVTLLDHSFVIESDGAADYWDDPRVFGNDVMAGGSEDDTMFGQLGDDIMQGDGAIELQGNTIAVDFDPSPTADPSFTVKDDQSVPDYFEIIDKVLNADLSNSLYLKRLYFHLSEQSTDGDDYMEGNGGNDRMYGDLGQDDMIGGSSSLFGLETVGLPEGDLDSLRPDGADLMYGGAGNFARLARNAEIDPETGDGFVYADENHGRDSDMMLGDNANIYRLVEVIEGPTNATEYLTFNYDQVPAALDEDDGYSIDRPIIPRAVELLDYFYSFEFYGENVNAEFSGIGYGDLMYGESGDDIIHGMTGDDVLFGNSEDDDLYGQQGNDWISGGTGEDGILGDDGLIRTSRNDLVAEPLYGIEELDPDEGPLKNNETVNTNSLNAEISTPGNIQWAIINVEGDLKKTVDLLAFDGALGNGGTLGVNDIIYGGLNDDFIHAGGGDDAVSGGEALSTYYDGGLFDFEIVNTLLQDQQTAPTNPDTYVEDNPFWFDFAPYNPGNILRFEGNTLSDVDDPHGKTKQEFALYDEFNPRRKIMLDENGEAVTLEVDGDFDFLLNFNEDEGPLGYAYEGDALAMNTDGDDRIFGDLGNDWIVGGTGRDHMYGGRGDDLLNMDDDHNSGGEVTHKTPNPDPLDNTNSDEYQAYSDIVYGGAGRDIMILNTGADRAIDWVGEYNSYIVPFSPFGAFHISRALAPQIPEFLQDLSESDGVDTSVPDGARYVEQKQLDVRVDEPDPLRNGEPYGELGLVRQVDFDWQDQTGAPNDPQPGNLQGKREIMRRELFTDLEPLNHSFAKVTGKATVTSKGKLELAPLVLGESAVNIYHLDQLQPSYMEILATINANKDKAGYKSNAYIIFDFQSATDFKFAGVDVGLDKIQIGHYTEDGWIVDKQIPMRLKDSTDYDLTLILYGTVATIWVDENVSMSFDFGNLLNDGYIGLGTDNATVRFDDWQVQKLPPTLTFQIPVDFSSSDPFEEMQGAWTIIDDQYVGIGDPAVSTWSLDVALWSLLEYQAVIDTDSMSGLVFDYYGTEDFKFAAIDALNDQVVIGHYTDRGLAIDASVDWNIDSGADYTLGISMLGSHVSVTLNGSAVMGYVFNSLLTDGEIGLFSEGGATTFGDVLAQGDDPAYVENLTAAAAPDVFIESDSFLTYDELDAIVDEAIERWTDALGIDDALVASLHEVSFQIVDFSDLTLGRAFEDTILIDADAAGYGWFVDTTPYDDVEFGLDAGDGELAAALGSEAEGSMDLLTVVMHELGHVLGLEDLDPDTHDLMSETLDAGVRQLADDHINADNTDNVEANEADDLASLVVMDAAINEAEAIAPAAAAKHGSSWLTDFLTNGTGRYNKFNPKDDIKIVLFDDDDEAN